MNKPKIDISGQRFGKLIVKSFSHRGKFNHSMWLCLCDCGKETTVVKQSLSSGATSSCGCVLEKYQKAFGQKKYGKLNATHGLSRIPEYGLWRAMHRRCYRKTPAWKNYAGRGIQVCARWFSFENFYADVGKRPSPELTIDRKNNDGHYMPSNFRWATRREQYHNSRRPLCCKK